MPSLCLQQAKEKGEVEAKGGQGEGVCERGAIGLPMREAAIGLPVREAIGCR
jgi:hypothetical protein